MHTVDGNTLSLMLLNASKQTRNQSNVQKETHWSRVNEGARGRNLNGEKGGDSGSALSSTAG